MTKLRAYLYLSAILMIIAAYAMSACNVESPSSPDGEETRLGSGGSGPANATSNEPTPPATPTTPTASKLEWGEPKISADSLCIPIRNRTGKAEIGNLLAYDLGGLFENGKPQKLVAEKVKTFEDGTGGNLCVTLPRCYQWDLLQGPGEAPDPYTPPDNWEHFGYVYLDSDIEDEECKPPPPPPGCPTYTTDTSVREDEPGLIYTFSATINGKWFEEGQLLKEGKSLEVTVPYCASEAYARSFKFVPDGTPPGKDCSTPFNLKVPKCEAKCEDFDITMKATGPELTETEATYSFEVFVDGNSVATFKKSYPRKETGYSETECYVAQPTNDLRCEVCVTVKIPPKEKPDCDDFDTELRATKVDEDGSSITYRFRALLDGQEVDRFRRTYLKGRTERTERECYVFTPTNDLRCEDCTDVKVPPKTVCEAGRAAGCYYRRTPIGSPSAEAAWIGQGICFVHKDDGLSGQSFVATRDADFALVKFANNYHLYVGVKAGDVLTTCKPTTVLSDVKCADISHVSYFDCCEPD